MEGLVSALCVDAREKACPLPILELARALRTVGEGAEVELWATDPAVKADLDAFCAVTGHLLVSFRSEGKILRSRVRKSGTRRVANERHH